MSASPPIRYTNVDGINLAYQTFGDGPIDIIMVDEWATPLEGRWDVPAIAGRLNRLASFARIISFDKRGIGLSDRGAGHQVSTPELWVRDLVAVARATGADRPVVFGAHDGGPIALLYAASVALRTEALILVNTGPKLTSGADYPYGIDPEAWAPDLAGIVELWANGSEGENHIAAIAHDPWWRSWYAQARRQQASPRDGLALLTMLGELDVRRIAPAVRAPTLIVHRTGNRWWPVEGARWLADQIELARFVELEGADNYWWSGDADRVVDEVEDFLLGERATRHSTRELATIMFTDLVDSTATLTAIGDRAWRSVLDQHDSITLDTITRYGGTSIKSLGDGYLIQFDGPATAIHAAVRLRDGLRRAGLASRIALHTGEVERRDDDVSGVAVHLASRMLQTAAPGEIIVSGVVRGLVAGSGIRFTKRGHHRFKGIPDEWELHAVDAEPATAAEPVPAGHVVH